MTGLGTILFAHFEPTRRHTLCPSYREQQRSKKEIYRPLVKPYIVRIICPVIAIQRLVKTWRRRRAANARAKPPKTEDYPACDVWSCFGIIVAFCLIVSSSVSTTKDWSFFFYLQRSDLCLAESRERIFIRQKIIKCRIRYNKM